MEENGNMGSEENTAKGAGNTGKVEKKHKKRQKKILADLQKQIEFYFSEPNLQKDRFLRQRITESDNGCIEIETIASFNRMKQLCADISLIVKAMKLCPAIEVIDEKWVKPSRPLPDPKNVDAVTVYIERLPSHADHDWIKSLFSPCGNVVYVSLPRHKTTREIKGFAFVEFEKESEAEAALKMFAGKPKTEEEGNDETEMDTKTENDVENASKHSKKSKKRKAKLSESEIEDAKVKSKKSKRKKDEGASTSSLPDTEEPKKIKGTLEKDVCDENGHKKTKKENEKDNELSGSDDTCDESKSKKRKREDSVASDEDGMSNKIKKKESQEIAHGDDCASSKKSGEAGAQGGADGLEVDDEDKKKKKRKRKKKEKQEMEAPQLRVISKTEWLTLKKEYQKLQRQAMKEAKQKLRIEFDAKPEQTSETNEKSVDHKEDKTDRFESDEKTAKKEKKELPQKLEMLPGVVLKFSSNENVDKRQIRNLFSTIAPVAYLEKEDDSNTGHVRFATKGACDKVVEAFSASGSLESITIERLTEKEDKEYWEQLNNDRLERFQHGKKRNRNKRGRQKVTKKLDERNAKKRDHIHFED